MADTCDFRPRLKGRLRADWKARVINDEWCAHHGDDHGATISHRSSGFRAFNFTLKDPDAVADAARECEPPSVKPGPDAQLSWPERDAVIAWLNRVAVRIDADWDDIVRLSDALVRTSGREVPRG